MLTMFFGEKKKPCIDCTQIEGKWYCTMNCGPCVPPERPANERFNEAVGIMEKWQIEAERIKARDATILKGMATGIDEIVEKHAKAGSVLNVR